MTSRVTTGDLTPNNFLNKFKEDMHTLRDSLTQGLAKLNSIKINKADEPILNLQAQLPKPIYSDPQPPIGVFSDRNGEGTKYRAEPNAANIINNSLVCYLFDDPQIAARNAVTEAGAVLGLEPPILPPPPFTPPTTVPPLPFTPPDFTTIPGWETPAAKEEANKVDLNVQKVRTVLDPPFPYPPTQVTGPVPVIPLPLLPIPGAVKIALHSQTLVGFNSPLPPFLPTNFTALNKGDGLAIPLPTSPVCMVESVQDDSHLTLTFPSPVDVVIPSPAFKVIHSDTFAGPQAPEEALRIINPIQDTVSPISVLTQFKDKTKANYSAILQAPAPLTYLPSVIPGPFGQGKGATFLPSSQGAMVQIEPLQEGAQGALPLRQGPECNIAAIVRPAPCLPSTGYSIASVSSPIPAMSPFNATKYSLQLVAAPNPIPGTTVPRLYPRLTWQYFNLINHTPATVYAQSMVPIPMPYNPLSGNYIPSNPIPGSTPYFIAASRWKKELFVAAAPFSPLPGSKSVNVVPNLDVPPNPKTLLNYALPGDFFAFGSDNYTQFGVSSYQFQPPVPGYMEANAALTTIALSNGHMVETLDTLARNYFLGGGGPTMSPPYTGNPPKLIPAPQPKKLYSMGVTFYIGDLITGNFFIDDFVTYGMDGNEAQGGVPFMPILNRNLPYPAEGELDNFFVGKDPNAYNYQPDPHTNSGVFCADISANFGAEIYSIIASGNIGIGLMGTPLVPLDNFVGDLYMLNVPVINGNTSFDRNKAMTDLFNNCFADYYITGKSIRRSARSQIKDGGDVYLNYSYNTDLPQIKKDSTVMTATIDAVLNASNNPSIKNTEDIALATGILVPEAGNNNSELSLENYGIHMVDGRPYLPGETPVDGFKKLTDILGYDPAISVCVGKPNQPILVISIEERSESKSYDSCGKEFSVVNITERILGINISTGDAMKLAGISDPGLLILRLFWLGGIAPATVSTQQQLDKFGLYPEDAGAALLGESNGTLEVHVIPDQNIVLKLAGTDNEKKKLFTERNPVSLNINPTSGEMKDALLRVIRSPAPATSDGVINPVPPFISFFKTIDFSKAFGLSAAEMAGVGDSIKSEVGDLCGMVFDGLAAAVLNSNISLGSFQAALAPALEVINFNVGMSELSTGTYASCLGNFTASMAVPPAPSAPPAVDMPSPKSLLDRLRGGANEVASMAEKAFAVQDPISLMQDQIPVLGAVVGSVIQQTSDLMCLPKTMIIALQGGACGITIPPEIANSCINNNQTFNDFAVLVNDYLLTVDDLLNAAQQLFVKMSASISVAGSMNLDLTSSINTCLQQVSAFIAGLNGTIVQNNSQEAAATADQVDLTPGE